MSSVVWNRSGLAIGFGLLLSGVIAGLIVGGIAPTLLPWSKSPGGAANAAAPTSVPSLDPGDPVEAPGSATEISAGNVVPDMSVGDLKSEVELGENRTQSGAVAAFTSYSVWLIGSPAAQAEPESAAQVVGDGVINPADARLIAGIQRSPSDGFEADKGAYRVIGFSGTADKPNEVMVEVAAPLSIDGKTRWAVVGGVVDWTSEGWKVRSIRPREIPQPTSPDVDSFTSKERDKTLEGLSWQSFAEKDGR